MTKDTFKAFLFCLFIFTSSAQAGILIEPYLGYSFAGSIDSSISNAESDYSGVNYGGRLGYQFLGFMGGLDYSQQSLKGDDEDGSKSKLGLFVGYNAPILFRVWGTYFLSSSLEFDESNDEPEGGKGYGLGIGYTGLPFVSLNLEYRTISYDELKDSSVPNFDLDAKEILFSVSLPFNL